MKVEERQVLECPDVGRSGERLPFRYSGPVIQQLTFPVYSSGKMTVKLWKVPKEIEDGNISRHKVCLSPTRWSDSRHHSRYTFSRSRLDGVGVSYLLVICIQQNSVTVNPQRPMISYWTNYVTF